MTKGYPVKPIIEARTILKRFGNLAAVDGISFEVRQGECFGILGPNGAGKTSTIRMIYAFSPLTGGELRVFGRDITTDARAIKSRIGVCQQENSLDPDLTVKENLEVFAGYFNMPRKAARKRAEHLLSFNALEHRAHAKVSELSGGLMRRLVLARALVSEPYLLILDEPTSGLDPQTRHQIWERLEKLKAEGLTILLTTHYMDEASRLCDRLIIMDKGRIIVEGKPMHLIRRYVGSNVIEIAEPGADVQEYVNRSGLQFENIGHRLLIYGQENDSLFRTISKTFCTEGCILRTATLEDVFLKLTGRDLRE